MIINSYDETQVVPKGNLQPRFREEERLKVKKVSFQLRNQMRKCKECSMLGLILKGTKINGKEGKHKRENIEETL